MNKTIYFFLMIILFFPSSLNAVESGVEDKSPPSLISIAVNKIEVGANEKFKITAIAEDDISGVSHITVRFSRNSGSTSYEGFLFYVGNDTFEGEILVGNISSGELILSEVRVVDKADNVLWLQSETVPLFSIKIMVNGKVDNPLASPEVKRISFDKSSYYPGDLITAIITPVEGSIINRLYLYLTHESNFKSLATNISYNEKEKVYYATYKLSDYALNGSYCISDLGITGDNGSGYWYNNYNNCSDKKYPEFSVISKINEIYDPPKLTEISINKKEVIAPSEIQIRAKITSNSPITQFYLTLECEKLGNKFLTSYLKYDTLTGEYTGKFVFDQFFQTSNCKLYFASIKDSQGNETTYDAVNDPFFEDDFTIKITNNRKPNQVVTSTVDKNILEKITSAPGGSVIGISYSGWPTAKKEVFDKIKGTDKVLVFEDEGFQWVFNGAEVDMAKDVNLKILVVPLYLETQSNRDSMQEVFDDAKVVSLLFSPNGKLPAPAKIKIKLDYTLRNYLGVKELYIYYYNENTGFLERVGEKIYIDGEGYITFTVSHNSRYMMSATKIDGKKVELSSSKKILENIDTETTDAVEESAENNNSSDLAKKDSSDIISNISKPNDLSIMLISSFGIIVLLSLILTGMNIFIKKYKNKTDETLALKNKKKLKS